MTVLHESYVDEFQSRIGWIDHCLFDSKRAGWRAEQERTLRDVARTRSPTRRTLRKGPVVAVGPPRTSCSKGSRKQGKTATCQF